MTRIRRISSKRSKFLEKVFNSLPKESSTIMSRFLNKKFLLKFIVEVDRKAGKVQDGHGEIYSHEDLSISLDISFGLGVYRSFLHAYPNPTLAECLEMFFSLEKKECVLEHILQEHPDYDDW